VPNIDGTGIEPGPNGTTAAVWGNNTDGSLSRIDLTVTPPKAASVGNHGAYGDMAVVGPDGSFYASSGGSVVKVTNPDGTCGLVSSAPTLTLRLRAKFSHPRVFLCRLASPMFRCLRVQPLRSRLAAPEQPQEPQSWMQQEQPPKSTTTRKPRTSTTTTTKKQRTTTTFPRTTTTVKKSR
jgi:hypothetical protein